MHYKHFSLGISIRLPIFILKTRSETFQSLLIVQMPFLRSNLVGHLGLKTIIFRDGTPCTKKIKTNEELVIKRVFLLSNMFQYYNVHLECSNKTEDFFSNNGCWCVWGGHTMYNKIHNM